MTCNPFWHVESYKVNCNLVGFTWVGGGNTKLVWSVLTGFIHLLPITVFESNIYDDLCLCLFVCLSLLTSFFTLSLSPKGCADCSMNLHDQETRSKYPGASACLRFQRQRTSLADQINMPTKLAETPLALIFVIWHIVLGWECYC